MGGMAEADTSPDTRPIPPRFWWLKRLVVVMVIFMALLIGLRYLSLHVAKRRLAAEIAAIRARGEPLEPEDFADRPAPAQEDAGPDLLAAMRMFAVPKQHELAWNQIPHFNTGTASAATVDAVLSANREALEKVRVARGKRVLNWGLRITWPFTGVPLSTLHDLRELTGALRIAAQKAIWEGKHDEAVEYLRDWLMVARSFESQPMLVSNLVADEMQFDVTNNIKWMIPRLNFGNGAGAASGAQVKALIGELLDEKRFPRSGWRWAWQAERMIQMELVYSLGSEEPRSGPFDERDHNTFVEGWTRPMMVADAQDLVRMANAYVQAAAAPDYPAALEILREWESVPTRYSTFVFGSGGAGGHANIKSQFQTLYYRREAAIALAARMFKLKYIPIPALTQLHLRNPDVDDLVPEFLPEAPLNPLRGGREKMSVHGDRVY
jgi:hypothetical protein